jgi:methionyl-tRNA formyltransferase
MSMGKAQEIPQDDSLATYAGKVSRDDARVDWSEPVDEVSRIVRAYDPKPAAFTVLHGTEIKLFGPRRVRPEKIHDVELSTPGQVIAVQEGVIVTCADGALCIRDVQPAGRSRMRSAEWARGRGIAAGDIFGS